MPRKRISTVTAIRWIGSNGSVEVYPLSKEGKHLRKMPRSPRTIYSKLNSVERVANSTLNMGTSGGKLVMNKRPELGSFLTDDNNNLSMDDFDLETMAGEQRMYMPTAIDLDQTKENALFLTNNDYDEHCLHNINSLYYDTTHNEEPILSLIL